MSLLEATNLKGIWLGASMHCTLFRLNTGKAWVSGGGQPQRLRDGSVVLPAARPIALGLSFPSGDPVVGASDLIGFTEVVVTPDMVGSTVAVLTCFEVKRQKGGAVRKVQREFGEKIESRGGIFAIVRSAEEAISAVRNFKGVRKLL